ncbi:MAG: hypothetical protein HQL95_07090 [Magnetococcales bacterium]|nr:hypothetical protein [Magnetococcales bacterium]
MSKNIFIPEVAEEIRNAYEGKNQPSAGELGKEYGVSASVITAAIQQAGGTMRKPGAHLRKS